MKLKWNSELLPHTKAKGDTERVALFVLYLPATTLENLAGHLSWEYICEGIYEDFTFAWNDLKIILYRSNWP